MNRSPRKRGFTLVELLVVISIIGMLAALLLPAVNAAREAARRNTCTSQQSQLSLAAINFEAGRGRFPGYREILPGPKEASWAVMLLSQMEQQQVYDLWADATVAANDGRLFPYLKIFRCPSDPAPDTSVPANSYIANAGYLPSPSPTTPPAYAELANDGVFVNTAAVTWNSMDFLGSRVNTSNLYDGSSNTVLFSESLLAANWTWGGMNNKFPLSAAPEYPNGSNVFCFLYASDDPSGTTHALDTGMPTPATATPAMKINGTKNLLRNYPDMTIASLRPSSSHSGGVVVTFADRATRFLRDSIEYRVYQQLMTTNSPRSTTPHRQFPLTSNDID